MGVTLGGMSVDTERPVHPGAVAAMRARIEGLRGTDGALDVDVLAEHLAALVLAETERAAARNVAQSREQRKEIRRLRLLAGTALPDPDREEVLRAINGCLVNAINAHGPITPEWTFSAAKRVLGHLVSRRYLHVPDEPVGEGS